MKLQTAVFLFAAAAIFCPGQAFPHDGAENDLPDEAVFVRPDAKLRGEIQLLIAGIDEKKEADFLRLNGIVARTRNSGRFCISGLTAPTVRTTSSSDSPIAFA